MKRGSGCDQTNISGRSRSVQNCKAALLQPNGSFPSQRHCLPSDAAALAREIAGEADSDLEPTVRRWLALRQTKLREIGELNLITARLADFCRSAALKMRRLVVTELGPAGDRQAIVGYLSLAHGADKPVVLRPEETLALHAALAVAALLALGCQAINRIFNNGASPISRRSGKSQSAHLI